MKNFISRSVANFAAKVALMLVAFGLVGCDDVKDLANSISIEQPLVSIESEYVETFLGNGIVKYLKIQSKDNDTKLENISANRGNCAFLQYELSSEKLKAYGNKFPDRVLLQGGTQIKTNDGRLIKPKDRIYSDDLDYLISLDDDSKGVYGAFFPRNLAFGDVAKFTSKFFKCKIDNIVEVELTINGGKVSYSFDNSIGF